MQTPETIIEVLAPSAIESITRAEVDTQISTAHRFPRSMQTFKRRAVEMATLDEETAASCLYSRPVGGGKFAEGLSVRTAEIVGACYGNLRVGAMIVEQTERYVTARGFAHDLESNFASSCEVIESTVKKDGSPYDERMRVVIAKSCLAKARRDATFQVVPKALCKCIETAARGVALGDVSTLDKRRDGAMGWVGKLGIDPGRVFAALAIVGAEEIGLEQLATLIGLKNAIKDGEVTVDEAFPPISAKSNLVPKTAPQVVKTQAVEPTAAAKPVATEAGATTVASSVVEEEPVGDSVTPHDRLCEAMEADGITLTNISGILKKHALYKRTVMAVAELPVNVVNTLLASWDMVKHESGA